MSGGITRALRSSSAVSKGRERDDVNKTFREQWAEAAEAVIAFPRNMVWLFTGRFPDGEVDGRTVKARLAAVVRELRHQ